MPAEQFVSVVMPVHNALPHLDAAVLSIVGQSHRDFEFVIYDDASTDGSTERLREWAVRDRRIRLIEGERNLGPAGSSALVVGHSTAPLVARMDADDTCHPDRLRHQIDLLEANPRAGLVASLFEVINAKGDVIRGPEAWRLARKTPFVPFAHGAMMFRRSVFEAVGGYREECEFWEDQDLVVRMARASEVLVIPRALYQVRLWTRNTRVASDPERVENAVDLMYRSVARLEQGRDYDDLLNAPQVNGARVDPRVFIAAGSISLWAGGRPRILHRLLKRGKLGWNLRSASAIVWTSWAGISPATLRMFMRVLLKSRNSLASRFGSDALPVRWAPPDNPEEAEKAR